MSIQEIRATYDDLADIAARFGTHSDRITSLEKRVHHQMALVRESWQGRGAAAFFAEMESEVLPACRRLIEALSEAQRVTTQISRTLREAEEEAAALFKGQSPRGVSASGDRDGGFFGTIGSAFGGGGIFGNAASGIVSAAGWVGDHLDDAWHWIEDHRNEIALGAAVVAAGIATVATGGLAAPIIAGALAAGGVTLGINAASDRYTLWDGVLGNTISGAFVGWGVGSAGAAISALRSTAVATNWAAGAGAATSQLTQVSSHALGVTRALTYAPHVLNAIGGGSAVVSSGGLDILIPEQYEGTVHNVSNVVGMGSAAANLGLAIGGNQLIRYAWSNPRVHPPGGSLVGGGNSSAFQSHHLYPQNQFGKLPFPANVLDDTVILPTGNHPFVPNLHTRIASGGIHPFLRDTFGRTFRQGIAPTLPQLQAANQQWMRTTLLTNIWNPASSVGIWGGIIAKQ